MTAHWDSFKYDIKHDIIGVIPEFIKINQEESKDGDQHLYDFYLDWGILKYVLDEESKKR